MPRLGSRRPCFRPQALAVLGAATWLCTPAVSLVAPLPQAVTAARAAQGESALALREELADRARSYDAGDWLREWLASLELLLPDVSFKAATFNFDISDGICNQIQVGGIQTSLTDEPGIDLRAEGLYITCKLKWSARSAFLPGVATGGSVTAKVTDSAIGSPIAFLGDGGKPSLPEAIRAHDCAGNITIGELSFSGSLVSAALEALRGFIRSYVNKQLETVICQNMDELVNTNGSQALSNLSGSFRHWLDAPSTSPDPPSHLPEPASDFADLSANPGARLLGRLFDEVLGNQSSPYSLNALADHFLGPRGLLSASSLGILPLQVTLPVHGLGTVNITIVALVIQGLNTWSNLSFATPTAQELALGLGLQDLVVNSTVVLDVAPSASGPLHGKNLTERFHVDLGLRNISAGGVGYLAVNQTRLGELSFDQLLGEGCLVGALKSALLAQSSGGLGPGLAAGLLPVGGDSLEKDVDNMLNLAIQMLLQQFTDAVGATWHHAISVTLRDAANSAIATTLAGPATCPAAMPNYTSLPLADTMVCLAVVFCALVPISLVALALGKRRKCAATSRRTVAEAQGTLVLLSECGTASPDRQAASATAAAVQEDASTATSKPGDSGTATSKPEENGASPVIASPRSARRLQAEASVTAALEAAGAAAAAPAVAAPALPRGASAAAAAAARSWDCLALHPRVPRGFRLGLPLLIIADICLFAAANAGIGVSVMLSLRADGEDVASFPPLRDFSLVSSVKEMWEAKVYALALLIALFSGVWPYVKLLWMLLCWFAPTSVLNVKRRQTLLDILDALGKWSLVDTFVMVLFMVAFRFDLSTTDYQLSEEIFRELRADAGFTVYVQPHWGFHIFLVATLASLVLGHVMCANHRLALGIGEYASSERCPDAGERLQLCHVLQPPAGLSAKVFAYIPAAAMIISELLVLYGIFEDSFQFTFEGMAGWLLGPSGAVRPFSVVSLAAAVPSGSMQPDSLGVRWLQCTFVLFAILAVLVYPAILLVLWLAPLSSRCQRRLFVTAQTLNAWSALDVLVVSIMASVLEIEQFAQSIIGDKCDSIDRLVARTPIAAQLPGAVTCFDVDTQLRPGFWILFVAAAIACVVGNIMMTKCGSALCQAS